MALRYDRYILRMTHPGARSALYLVVRNDVDQSIEKRSSEDTQYSCACIWKAKSTFQIREGRFRRES